MNVIYVLGMKAIMTAYTNGIAKMTENGLIDANDREATIGYNVVLTALKTQFDVTESQAKAAFTDAVGADAEEMTQEQFVRFIQRMNAKEGKFACHEASETCTSYSMTPNERMDLYSFDDSMPHPEGKIIRTKARPHHPYSLKVNERTEVAGGSSWSESWLDLETDDVGKENFSHQESEEGEVRKMCAAGMMWRLSPMSENLGEVAGEATSSATTGFLSGIVEEATTDFIADLTGDMMMMTIADFMFPGIGIVFGFVANCGMGGRLRRWLMEGNAKTKGKIECNGTESSNCKNDQ
jgi:hypothetical protein